MTDRADAPPAWAEPLFAFIERVDRRRLGIRRIRRGGISGIAFTRHHGPDVVLRDGTVVRAGELVGNLHLDNSQLARRTTEGWQMRMLELGREDARALMRWVHRQPPADRPVAYFGATILWPIMRRLGAEVRERPQTRRVRREDWYLRGVLRRWAREGTARLALGRGDLRTMDCWISASEMERRYGGPTPATADVATTTREGS